MRTLAHKPPATRDAPDAPDAHDARAARRLAVLREVDLPTHEALTLALPALIEQPGIEAELATLVDLLLQVAAEDPAASLVLARRLDAMQAALSDLVSLRKWALHGLQRHRDDAARRLHFFEWEDPLAFADRLTENDSAHLLACRDGLSHYLAGFGFTQQLIELHEPQAAGLLPPSVTIGDEVIRFPRRCPAFTSQGRNALYRASIAHGAAHLRHSVRARPAGNRQPTLLALIALIEDARVERLMQRDFPGLHALWGCFHVATRENAGFGFAGLAARLAHAIHNPAYVDGNAWVVKGRQLFEAAAAADLHALGEYDKIGRLLAIDIEKMRLTLPGDYRAQPAYRDDNALLWDMSSALPENESHTVAHEDFELRPSESTPPEVRHADVDLRRRTRYPEWDHRLEALREDWATVLEISPPSRLGKTPGVALRKRQFIHGLARTPDRSIRLAGLAEGDELDLNAAVDCVIDQRARLVPDGRIFKRHGRCRRSTAVVLLMDLSVSTERFVPGSFKTVLEVEKRAATLVADALDSTRDRVAVHGFASNGRHEVHYHRIKDFDEPFGAEQRSRLAHLQGGLSTRMGAALRHASAALQREVADNRVILMLTDGEPSDVDVFEDDHLVEDARHAVASAAARGVRTFCLTLDRQADDYVRRIFGARNYLIADRAAAFAGYTGQALVRLVAQ